MQKIFFISCLSDARKFELTEILGSVEEIVIKHDPEALGINGMFQLLLAEKPGLSKLTEVGERSYPDLDVLTDLYIRRDKVLKAIKSQLTTIENAALPAQSVQSKLVLPVIKRYLKDFRSGNLTEKSGMINALLEALNNAEIITALEDLFMTVYLDELKAIQTAINDSSDSKKTSVLGRQKSQMQQVKSSVLSALRNLFKAIELASIEHTDKDYSLLVKDLNNYLAIFNTVVKTRRLVRKQNAEKKEEEQKATAASTPTSIATAS